MNTNTMTARKAVITELDFDRLNRLIQSPRYRTTQWLRLTQLEQGLADGTIVAPSIVPKGLVTMRSRVRVRDLKSGETETYTLVYPEEAKIDEGRISVLAPLGTALLGARVGQTISVKVPAGVRRIRVGRILYQPEAAGDFDL